jgi:hypothetical protein
LKQIRKRLTYANVMSSLAVFLLLGGATAFAASKIGPNQLKANSVKTGKIVKEAVTTGKLKKNAVTEGKIAGGAITTKKIANDAVTGEKANESTFGKVPSAANADTVNGQSQTKVFKVLNPGQSDVTVATIAGFTLKATCEVGNIDVTLTAPGGTGTVLSAEGNGSDGGPIFEYDADEGGASEIRIDGEPPEPPGTTNSYGESTFSGATQGGTVVSGDVGYDYDTFGGVSGEPCIVYGEVASG